MDTPSDTPDIDPTPAAAAPLEKLPLSRKIISGATWGMITGFCAELPLAVGFGIRALFSRPMQVDTHALQKWSFRIVLPASVVGVVYGWLRPGQDQRRDAAQQERATGPNELTTIAEHPNHTHSWVQGEQARAEAAPVMNRQ
ncbi:MAG: hypothetical protein WDN72_01360 [Alphaproteobacteria bacterium]